MFINKRSLHDVITISVMSDDQVLSHSYSFFFGTLCQIYGLFSMHC